MQTQITCPNCGMPYSADIHQVVDVGRQPRLKELLLSGQLNVAVCPSCGAGGRVATPLLYHDPAHELFMVHVPQEMNLDQVRREEMIGRLVQDVVNATPQEKRRGYMLQPKTMLTMQSFMEAVWGTEGVTPEMLARQQKQVELMSTLATAAPDVQDYLLKERGNEIDETFFAILRSQIDALSQTGDDRNLIPLLNLQAKLMTETAIGRDLEKRQMALHALNREAQKAGGLTPELLVKHVKMNRDDEALVGTIGLAAQAGLSYEFFSQLTAEIEKMEKSGDKTGAATLTARREQLLELQASLREASQQVLQQAQSALNEILAADDMEAAVAANLDNIDDAFLYVLDARVEHAHQSGRAAELERLNRLQELLVKLMESAVPVEVDFLNQLLQAADAKARATFYDEHAAQLSPDLAEVILQLSDQARSSGQAELADRLVTISEEVAERANAATAAEA